MLDMTTESSSYGFNPDGTPRHFRVIYPLFDWEQSAPELTGQEVYDWHHEPAETSSSKALGDTACAPHLVLVDERLVPNYIQSLDS